VQRIYLDHNATTPLDPRVVEAMLLPLREDFGNPSSIHWFGQQARARIDDARASVARLLGVSPQEIVFTGSGTEADNMALRGVAGMARAPRRGIVVSGIEHHAVLNTAKALREEGFPLEIVRAREDGRVDLQALRAAVGPGTALVALMLANNETGVVQPIEEVVALAREQGALVHCDAVQAAGKLALDLRALGVDTAAVSAHKLCGPKGVGALYVRRGTRLAPFLRGGSQEKNRRAGTENVAGVVGFGKAAELAFTECSRNAARLGALRDRLERSLLEIPGAAVNGGAPRVPNTCNISFEAVEAESLLMALDLAGLAVSTGAACAAGAVEPSHVLRAMGLPPERVQASLRLSLGPSNREDEVDEAARLVAAAVAQQRSRRATAAARA